MGMTITGALDEYILSHLTSWQYNDDISDKVDQLGLSFNASRVATLPEYGGRYKLAIHGVSRGEWEIIEKSIDQNEIMSLKLSNVSKSSKVKEKATESFSGKTVEEIISKTVSPCGYKFFIAPVYASKVVNYFRHKESVGDFINRMAADLGAVSKPYDGCWYFNEKHKTTNSTGVKKPSLSLTNSDKSVKYSLVESGDKKFNGVKVTYLDLSDQIKKTIFKGETPFNDQGEVTQAKANDIINSYSNYNKNASKRVTVTLPTSNTKLGTAFAEGVLQLDLGRFIKGSFIIDSISMNQKETTIQASVPND